MSTLPQRAPGPLDPDRPTVRAAAAVGGGRHPVAAAAGFLFGWALLLFAALVGTGLFLARYATGNDLAEADTTVARWLVNERTPTLNEVTNWVSMMADTFVVIGVAAVAMVVARLVFKRWREGMVLLAALAGEVTLFLSTTSLVDRARPGVTPLDDAPPTSSFPSGHVAAAVCLYGAFALLAWFRMRPGLARALLIAVLALVPVAIAIARMYRGMHYLSDVVAGLILGWAWLAVSARGVRRGVTHALLRRDHATPAPVRRP